MLLNPPHKFKISKDSRWPEYTKSGTLYYPFWLSYATGILMESKHEPFLLDAIAKGMTIENTIEEIKKFNPNLLVVETSTPTIHNDVKFSEEVKKSCDTKIVIVGTHVSALPDETMKMSNAIDFLIRQEFDYAVLELADAIEKNKGFKTILGLSYRDGGKIFHNPPRPLVQDLDKIPFVSKVYKKFLDVKDYRYALAMHPMIQIWTSRGCPSRCTFCDYPQTFSSRMFRERSAKNVVDEIEWIKNNLPEIKEIFIEDDTFTVDRQRVLEICEEIKKRGLKTIWSCNVRANLDYEMMKEMKEAGCRILIVGYESGNQEILNKIKKGIVLEQAEKFTSDAQKARLKIFGCFMIGLPGDTKETIEQTFQFAKKLNPDMVFFQQAVPFPGTEFYNWAKENGYLVAEDYNKWLDENGRLDFLISYPDLTNKEIAEIREKLMMRFYFDPKHIVRTIGRNLHPYEFFRVIRYAKDYLFYLVQRKFSKSNKVIE